MTIAITFISSKNAKEEHVMHSKSSIIKYTFYNDAKEVVDELFESLFLRCQANLEKSMKGSEFIFDSVRLMC